MPKILIAGIASLAMNGWKISVTTAIVNFVKIDP
jgi:hypothetical protein